MKKELYLLLVLVITFSCSSKSSTEKPQQAVHPHAEGIRLIAKNDCKTCHLKNMKNIGPSYMDIAKKYANTEENLAMLAGKVKSGGSGVWGSTIMTPHPQIKDNELQSMVAYILSLDEENQSTKDSINTLSAKEKAEGWKLLFDGHTTKGWRKYNSEGIGSSWQVKDGVLYLDSEKTEDGHWQAADGGDIITNDTYENFELRLEWKISDCGNSGVIFNIIEDEKYDYVWHTGPELQILDNTCHPDAKFPTHLAGDLYDIISTKDNNVNPAGEWNKVRILSDHGKVQFWLNDIKSLEFEMHTDQWKQMIAKSKFKDLTDFGTAKGGHIALQDHGDPVYFRGIKIREIK